MDDQRARWFSSLFAHAPVGIAIADIERRIVDSNPAFEDMLGYPREDLRGSVFTDHSHPDDAHLDEDLFEELLSGTRSGYSVEKRYLRRDGATVWGRTTAWVLRGDAGAPTRVLGIVEDVTEARVSEAKCREQSELAKLGQMAAVIAHEVKNPLAAIGGAIQVIGDRLPERSPEREIIVEVRQRLAGLNAIVDDLAMFARPVELQREPTDVAQLLRDCAVEVPRVVLKIDGEAVIRGDRRLLGRLFRALCSNAAEAAETKAAAVSVSIAVEGDTCHVSVHDDGSGLDDEAHMVFEPFYTTKTRGVGLGLAIARRVAEAHGGWIEATSPETGGTTIRVSLPSG